MDGWMDEASKLRLLILLTLRLKQYQECNTLVTRIEVRIMRLRKEKGVRIKGRVASHPRIQTYLIIILVLYLV